MTALATRPDVDDQQPGTLALVERSNGLLARLERAEGLEDVLHIHAEASALGALARAARLSLEEQNCAAMVRVRIQHRAGSLLRDMAVEARPGRASRPRGKAPLRPQLPRGVLQAHGISGQESSLWQALASLPIDDVVQRMDELSAHAQEVTAAEFYRRGRASLRRRSSRLAASPTELRLRAALTNLARIRTLTTVAEREMATKIAQVCQGWGVRLAARPDLGTILAVCMLCGRERHSPSQRRCECGGNWTTTLR